MVKFAAVAAAAMVASTLATPTNVKDLKEMKVSISNTLNYQIFTQP